MIDVPFAIFAPFSDRLSVRFFTREDGIATDADLANALHDDRIASLNQTHGANVAFVREPTSRSIDADALFTDVPGLHLSIRAADCGQFIVYAPEHRICGAIHAGWKGLKAGVIPAFFAAVKRDHGIAGEDAYVGIGPSLCTACAEFTDPAAELSGLDPRFFHGHNVDLRGIADMQLDEAGVPRERRERMNGCTRCERDRLFSYRGDKASVDAGKRNVFTVVMR